MQLQINIKEKKKCTFFYAYLNIPQTQINVRNSLARITLYRRTAKTIVAEQIGVSSRIAIILGRVKA